MPKQAFGSPRLKYRRQLEQQGVPKEMIEKILLETFGPEPKGRTDPELMEEFSRKFDRKKTKEPM